MEKKQINMNIHDGEEFFAHETSINFSPTQFILDFRCITPRIDPRAHTAPQLNLKHNVIMLDPWHAKEILRILQNSLKNYEDKFGKIEKPAALEKQMEQKDTQLKPEETKAPSYFG